MSWLSTASKAVSRPSKILSQSGKFKISQSARAVREDPDRHHGHDGSDADAVAYSNRWIVHLEDANDESARVLANSMGCQLVGAVGKITG